MHFLKSVNAHRNANVVFSQKGNGFIVEQCGVGGDGKIDLYPVFICFLLSVSNNVGNEIKIKQRLPAEKNDDDLF